MQRGNDITIDEARGLVSDAALWPLVRDFLWDFARQIHPSWIEDVLSSGGEGETETRGGRPPWAQMGLAALRGNDSPRVNAWVLGRFGIQPCFHVFPKDDWSRLLLLDCETLESLVKWLGTLACADGLRRVTDGATVRELKSALPGVYPEVFGYTAYFPKLSRGGSEDAGSRGDGSYADSALGAGYGMLAAFLSGLPEPILSRLKFKLPKRLGATPLPAPQRDASASSIVKLLKLRFPEAYSLCCS